MDKNLDYVVMCTSLLTVFYLEGLPFIQNNVPLSFLPLSSFLILVFVLYK